MTNRAGNLVQHYGYTPFGDEHYQNNTQAFSLSNRYTGQILDEETGLYYYGARYYNPELARFIQADSVIPDELFSQALNRYTYVYNNPLKFFDPTGQHPFAFVLFTIGTTQITVGTVVIGAAIGAGMAALTGGNILKGALVGAIGGVFGATGNLAMAMAGGALGALVTGGDPMMGAISAGIAAGISAGVAACFKDLPLACVFESIQDEYLRELTYTTTCGALAGGVTAEVFGGDFAQCAAYGAAAAAAGYVVSKGLEVFSEDLIAGVGKSARVTYKTRDAAGI
jgi:RHS repeat-associated protein